MYRVAPASPVHFEESVNGLQTPQYTEHLKRLTVWSNVLLMSYWTHGIWTPSSLLLNVQLYEMMIMAFKHEVVNATCPSYLLATTINHLRGMRDLVGAMDGGDTAIGQLDVAEVRMLRDYGGMSQGQWLLVRQTLLAFVQTQRSKVRDVLVRVSAQGTTYCTSQ
jgi:hypothetical protein